MLWGFGWFMLAVAVGVWAHNRGRSGFAWMLLSLVISPLLGLVFCGVSKDLSKPAEPSAATHVKCPACAEYVLPEATRCKHCGGALVPQPASAAILRDRQMYRKDTTMLWVVAGWLAAFCVGLYLISR